MSDDIAQPRSRRRRRIACAAAVGLATSIALLAAPAAARADAAHPFRATGSGSGGLSSASTVETHGFGQAIGMGRLQFDGVAQIESPTAGTCANGFPNVNVEVLTAANGDQLVIRSDDIACPTGPASFHGTGSWQVVSGTGRFAQAHGGGTTDARGDFAAGTFDFTFVGSLSGQG